MPFFEFIVDLLWGASEIFFFSKEKDKKQKDDELRDYMKREYGEKRYRPQGDAPIDDRIDR